MQPQTELIGVLKAVLQDPRGGFRQFQALGFSTQVLWQMLVIVTLIWVLLFGVVIGWELALPQADLEAEPMLLSIPPFLFFGLNMIYAVVRVHALYHGAKFLGGASSVKGALELMLLSDALWVLALLTTGILAVISVGLADLFLLLVSLLLLYCLLVFIDEACKFENLWTAAGALVLTTVGAFVALFILVVLVSAVFG